VKNTFLFMLAVVISLTANAAGASVCALVISLYDAKVTGAVISCDGQTSTRLNPISTVPVEEISGELGKLYAQGLHLVSCQTNSFDNGAQYICVTAK
jgi:hypothetical protein